MTIEAIIFLGSFFAIAGLCYFAAKINSELKDKNLLEEQVKNDNKAIDIHLKVLEDNEKIRKKYDAIRAARRSK